MYDKKPKKYQWYAVAGSIIPDLTLLITTPILWMQNAEVLLDTFSQHQDISISRIDYVIGSWLNSLWLWLLVIGIGCVFSRSILALGVG